MRFQSTHSLRSATPSRPLGADNRPVSIHALLAECDALIIVPNGPLMVSIHALLAECDQAVNHFGRSAERFNPRTPCGVRQAYKDYVAKSSSFQSTHSLRSATMARITVSEQFAVSIHALLAECDRA